jgi:putative salt-induced outer membrane protein YdiY
MRRTLFLLLLLAFPLSAQDAPADVPDPWTSSAGAGLAMTSGNTDSRTVNLSFNTMWDPKAVAKFKADAVYLRGSTNGEKQVDKLGANARYEHLVSDRAFWFGEVAALRDPFKDISYLVAPLAGGGYHVIRTETKTLTFDGAAGGIVESGELAGRSTSGAVKAGQSYDWKISPATTFTQKLSGIWKADDPGDALYHFDAGLATAIAERLELKLSYLYDYKNEPPSPEIEKGDSAFFAAILVKF